MDQLKAFFDKAKTDEELMAKLYELGKREAPDEEIIALASEHGFTITKEEIEIMKSHSCSSYVSCKIQEEDLENATGGYNEDAPTKNRYDPKTCPTTTRTKYECVGFLEILYCDHLRREPLGNYIYHYKCMMGAFDYIGNTWGTPTR